MRATDLLLAARLSRAQAEEQHEIVVEPRAKDALELGEQGPVILRHNKDDGGGEENRFAQRRGRVGPALQSVRDGAQSAE